MRKTGPVKWLLFLLTFLMMSGALVSCTPNDTPNENTSSDETDHTSTESENTTETGAPPVSSGLVLAKDKTTEYVVTYASDADESVVLAAKAFVKDFQEATGAAPALFVERFNTKAEDIPAKEIIIGDTARADFDDFYAGIGYNEFAIAVKGDKILIGGNTVLALLDGLDHFCSNILTSDSPSIAENYSYASNTVREVKSIKIDGKDISEFRIIYTASGSSARQVAVNDLFRYIATASGIELTVEKYRSNLDVSNSIVIGETQKHAVKTVNYGDCMVYAENGTIYVDGTDICGLESGVAYLADILTADENVDLKSSAINYSESLQDRNVYLANSSAFDAVYRRMHFTSAEELTLDYKIKQLNDPNGEVMLIAHRGEHIYYPENSLEGTISAWLCGASATEVDIQKTKDGVWVCMHDSTLTRTTNVASLKGKNGLPDSVNISDWTLEELRQLNLLDSYGQVTPFLIPTVEEILVACDDKIFIHFDKSFDYVNDIFPLMEKTGVYECVYLVNNIKYDQISKLNDYFQDKGIKLQNVVRVWSRYELASTADKITHPSQDLTPAIVPLGDYNKFEEADFAMVEKYVGKVRLGAWMLRENDIEYLWREAIGRGFNLLLTDYPFDLINDIRAH